MTAAAGEVPGRSPPAGAHPRRPTDESCSYWIGPELRYCCSTDDVTRYVQGYRCRLHDVRRLAGLPDLPPSPGIRALRPPTPIPAERNG